MKILIADTILDKLDFTSDNCLNEIKDALKDHDARIVNFNNAVTALPNPVPTQPYRYSLIDRNFMMAEYLEKYEKLFSPQLIIANDCVLSFADLKTPAITVAQNMFSEMGKRLKDTHGIAIDYEMRIYDDLQKRQLLKSQAVALNRHISRIMGIEKIIETGIDIDFFNPDSGPKKYGGLKTGLWIGKFIPRYSFNFVSQLAKDFPKVQWILVFEHDMDKDPKLPNVRIVKPNNLEELRSLYNAADFFINTNMIETNGINALRAASCNVPVVVPRSGWFWDCSIGYQDIGHVISKFEYQEFKSAVDSIVKEEYKYKPRQAIMDAKATRERFNEEWKDLIDKKLSI